MGLYRNNLALDVSKIQSVKEPKSICEVYFKLYIGRILLQIILRICGISAEDFLFPPSIVNWFHHVTEM